LESKPISVQSNRIIYVFEKRDPENQIEYKINLFADLIKAPEGIHTYIIDEYSLWSAAARNATADNIISVLDKFSLNKVSTEVKKYINQSIKEFEEIKLLVDKEEIILNTNSDKICQFISDNKKLKDILINKDELLTFVFKPQDRILLKKVFVEEKSFNVFIEEELKGNEENNSNYIKKMQLNVKLRKYQKNAVKAFMDDENKIVKKNGVICMPPGSGKNIVGLKIIEESNEQTLILVQDKESGDTWKEMILKKTNYAESDIGNQTVTNKSVVIMDYKYARDHFDLLQFKQWGLIIYDDAHLIPANKTSQTVHLISKYKLGLTSILNREDGKGGYVLKYIGPKLYNITLKQLETEGYQIKVKCIEVKLPIDKNICEEYEQVSKRKNPGRRLYNIVGNNECKVECIKEINKYCNKKNIVIFSTYEENENFAEAKQLGFEVMNGGNSKAGERTKKIYDMSNKLNYKLIVTGIVEKMYLDDIDVAVSISYNGKSEREEFLRIGKLKSNTKGINYGLYFALVTEDTEEESAYRKRRDKMVRYGYNFVTLSYEEFIEALNGGENY
jgi:DNA excision repair protein ERCC-3